jgi:hypothetical protein
VEPQDVVLEVLFDIKRDVREASLLLRGVRTMKRMNRDEFTEHLLETDRNFRRLYERIVELTGAPPPSSEEIDHLLEQRIAQRRERS